MFFIVILLLLGMLFLFAEIVLLPGFSVGGILSLVCYGGAIYLGFREGNVAVGCTVVAVVLLLSIVTTCVSLRAKTWQRFSLRQKIDSTTLERTPEQEVRVGDFGVTLSRLSPMGRVSIGGKSFEAKSEGSYVDPNTEVEVTGFENFSVIVKVRKS